MPGGRRWGWPNRVAARSDAGNLVIDVPFGTYAVTTHTNAGDDSVGGIVNDPRAANRIDMRTQAGNSVVRAR